MQPTRIGSFEINRISDYEGPFFDPAEFFPDFDPAVVDEHAALLGPRRARGRSLHTLTSHRLGSHPKDSYPAHLHFACQTL